MFQSLFLATGYQPQITQDSTMIERITMGLETMAFGMIVIFAVLMLIWGILELFHIAFHGVSKEKKAPAPKKVAPAPAPAPVAPQPVASPVQDDGALIAAITAAIAVAMQQPTTSFRVVSFKRTNKNTPWNQKNI